MFTAWKKVIPRFWHCPCFRKYPCPVFHKLISCVTIGCLSSINKDWLIYRLTDSHESFFCLNPHGNHNTELSSSRKCQYSTPLEDHKSGRGGGGRRSVRPKKQRDIWSLIEFPEGWGSYKRSYSWEMYEYFMELHILMDQYLFHRGVGSYKRSYLWRMYEYFLKLHIFMNRYLFHLFFHPKFDLPHSKTPWYTCTGLLIAYQDH